MCSHINRITIEGKLTKTEVCADCGRVLTKVAKL